MRKLLESRNFYLVLAFLLLLYMVIDAAILNLPKYFFWLNFILSFISIVLLLYFRYRKYPAYYQRKFRDKTYLIFSSIAILFFSLVFQFYLYIPIDILVYLGPKQPNFEYYQCRITDITQRGYNKVTFEFLDRKYTRRLDIGQFERDDLIENYLVELEVKKSLFGAYYVSYFDLKSKE